MDFTSSRVWITPHVRGAAYSNPIRLAEHAWDTFKCKPISTSEALIISFLNISCATSITHSVTVEQHVCRREFRMRQGAAGDQIADVKAWSVGLSLLTRCWRSFVIVWRGVCIRWR